MWEERRSIGDGPPRSTSDITTSAALTRSRARIWRLQPRTRGHRHVEGAQEEAFLVLSGTLTVLLGEPAKRFDVVPESVISVEPGTGLRLRNEGDEELILFAYGAPPVPGQAEFLGDVEDLDDIAPPP